MNLKPFYGILILIGLTLVKANRELSVTWNPGCDIEECKEADENGSYINLLYVKLTGQSNIIHILYSNIESFTVMLFETNLNVNMKINWTNLLSKNATFMRNSIEFSEKPIDIAGYEFPSVYEFNDTNGNADLSLANQTYVYKTADLVWKKFSTNESNSGVFEAYRKNTNGSFKFVVRYPGEDQRDKSLPHLLLKPESSSIEFIIDSVEPKSEFSKFALNIVFLTNYIGLSVSSKRTIDDEYTPGTFKLWNVQISDDENSIHNYLQYKPIFYFNDPKTLENSTITKQYDYKQMDSFSNSIGLVFFDAVKQFSAMNVSFGLEGNQKDGYYYIQTNYSSWSFSIGMGSAPNEKMSFVVTIVIFAGFGLPALAIAIGLVVMVIRKIRGSNQSEFSPL